jgi:hypothetical protein
VEHYANLLAKQVQQDFDPLTICHALIQSEAVAKGSLDDADVVTRLKFLAKIELDQTGVIMPPLQVVDNGSWEHCWFIAMAD